ncbi:RH5 [Bovine adenovirus 7]|uniref:RH5 protein n=1 Tax=Bovine adenovirus 7 TaxID=10511 RepID=A0A7R7IZU8_ADEB7|nr:RH5 [Bovine adenovirus 7]BCS90534.1 RH5 [Bovine adenovirus 7]
MHFLLKSAMSQHANSCLKTGCDLHLCSKIDVKVLKNTMFHYITLNFTIVHHIKHCSFSKVFTAFIRCSCRKPFTVQCFLNAVNCICKSESSLKYATENFQKDRLFDVLLKHHAPFENNCLSVQCLLTGFWNLVASVNILNKHFYVIKEEILYGQFVESKTKCRLKLKQILRGECFCANPLSDLCLSSLLTEMCKLIFFYF